MTLVWNKIFYNYCWRKNGTTMLKSADHDSINGEHVGTTSGINVTSGKSRIWPLEAPKNDGFGRMWKFPRGKRPRHIFFWIYSIWEEAVRFLVCWGKWIIYCCYEHFFLSVRQEEVPILKTIVEDEFWVFPHGFMVRLGAERDK